MKSPTKFFVSNHMTLGLKRCFLVEKLSIRELADGLLFRGGNGEKKKKMSELKSPKQKKTLFVPKFKNLIPYFEI